MKSINYIFLFCLLFVLSCETEQKLFELIPSTESKISFVNTIKEDQNLNVLQYEYFYNGGGVASGDLNNDGLVDLYFTANMGSDAIYINQGNLVFEDISAKSGITYNGEWKTGVTMVDINNDGWLDIYVSCSGNEDNPKLRKNKLYINNKDLTFSEQAEKYGLASDSFTTHTAFFDYDKDGDLDAYIMNHNVKDFKSFDVAAIHEMKDQYAGDQLLRNDDGLFIDVTDESGIKNNPIGFGLGINVSDINGDNWPDIYISNDYIEGDYLYINQQDGTFRDEIKNKLDHTSYFSMGNDIGDVNNDLLPDIFTADMLPEDNIRQKLLFGPEKYEAYLSMLRNGFLPEVMRNMLHLNNGDGTFSEIGQLAGISNTDWSWSPLIADFDNDGNKDLFISNGYLRDYTNNDFIKFYAEERSEGRDNVLEIISKMPSTKITNYIFKNNGNASFEDKRDDWGIDEKIISNGAIYADLDNDGDLEIITNNINEPASIYKNNSKNTNYISITLNDEKGTNAKVILYAGGQKQLQENTYVHGFQSSSMAGLHFGLGNAKAIDSLVVFWNDGKTQKLTSHDVPANSRTIISYSPNGNHQITQSSSTYFEPTNSVYFHEQMEINDFSRQILLPYMYSYQGPALAAGDLNGDTYEDFFLGGGKEQAARVFLGGKSGSFSELPNETFKQDELTTDADAQLVDFDKDGDLDILVTGSGYEYLTNDLMLQNRLYLNDGKGKFTKDFEVFPADFYADSKLTVFDFDKDGDMDVLVGGYVVPLNFPLANPTRLYENKNGKLVVSQQQTFENIGIVTSIVVSDFDANGFDDIMIATEWGPISVYWNSNGVFAPKIDISPNGLWQSLALIDLDGDGVNEVLAGNFGKNSQFKASKEKPMKLQIGDFDQNQRIDLLLNNFIGDISYPFFSRDELADQLPMTRKLYTTYAQYSTVTSDQLLKDLKTPISQEYKVETLASHILTFQNESWKCEELPFEFQYGPIYAFAVQDIDQDGRKDIITGGNNYRTRVRIGNLDANHGQLFLNKTTGLSYVPNAKSGLNFVGDVRSLALFQNNLIVGTNSGTIQTYRLNSKD